MIREKVAIAGNWISRYPLGLALLLDPGSFIEDGALANVPVLEPSDAQEALDFTQLAFDLSELFDTPVIVDNKAGGVWGRFLEHFEGGFERARDWYTGALTAFLTHKSLALTCVSLMLVGSFVLLRGVGEDFFPPVDAGMMRLHVRLPTGTRIEKTEWVVDAIEHAVLLCGDTARNLAPMSQMLNVFGRFFIPSLAPAWFNVAAILGIVLLTPLFASWGIDRGLSLAAGAMAGGLLQAARRPGLG